MSFRFRKSVRIIPGVLLLMLGACASPSSPSPSPEYQPKGLAEQEQRPTTTPSTPAPQSSQVTTRAPAHPEPAVAGDPLSDYQRDSGKLLDEMIESNGRIAAAGARCGYWDGWTWRVKLVEAGVRLEDDKSVIEARDARFVELFDAELEKPTRDLPCSVVHELALDNLVLLDSVGDY
jgi:hypothetical protein